MLKSFCFLCGGPVGHSVLALQGRSSAADRASPPLRPHPRPPSLLRKPLLPPPAAPVKNPVKPTPESQAKAKSLYQMDCAMCHGDNGNGKTDLATSMEPDSQ